MSNHRKKKRRRQFTAPNKKKAKRLFLLFPQKRTKFEPRRTVSSFSPSSLAINAAEWGCLRLGNKQQRVLRCPSVLCPVCVCVCCCVEKKRRIFASSSSSLPVVVIVCRGPSSESASVWCCVWWRNRERRGCRGRSASLASGDIYTAAQHTKSHVDQEEANKAVNRQSKRRNKKEPKKRKKK